MDVETNGRVHSIMLYLQCWILLCELYMGRKDLFCLRIVKYMYIKYRVFN